MLPIIRISWRSRCSLVDPHLVDLKLYIGVGSNPDGKNVYKLVIQCIISHVGLVNARCPFPHMSDVILNEGVPNQDIRGASIVRVLTKEGNVCMGPIVVTIQAIIPLLFKLNLSQGKGLTNHCPHFVSQGALKGKSEFSGII